jgi:hypothetical protein
MKTLTLFLVLALALLAIGCEESPINRIAGNPVAPAAPATPGGVKTLTVAGRADFRTPEGVDAVATVLAELKYVLVEFKSGLLSKEIPVRPIYSVKIEGEGKIDVLFLARKNALAKAGVWTFKGSLDRIVQEGETIALTFNLEGATYQRAHVHMDLQISEGSLIENMLSVDFHERAEE